jgi:phosphoglycerate-specific signal transduction histidine kinase
MIIMQIDSTYEAISLLDDVKEEMTEFSPAELTATERNKKSKAIFNINIIQNELTRSLDAAILANLRVRTNELAGITAELQKNVGHLQTVTEKLNKATLCIGRLTNILALGLSKGIIKPFTPKTSSAEAVKAAL